MLPQGDESLVNSNQLPNTEGEVESGSETVADTPQTSSVKPLFNIFEELSETSESVNQVLAAIAADDTNNSSRTLTAFESLQMLTVYTQPPKPAPSTRKRIHFDLDYSAVHDHNMPPTPKTSADHRSRWADLKREMQPFSTGMPYTPYTPYPIYTENNAMTEEELVRMKGPSRLIGFLVDIAMNERARAALRWTGNGLEFILVNKELVAKMWGNRKHNTKDMDYYKLSRAIREKYDKKEKNSVTKNGKLKKGTRTYSYVFTENAYTDLMSQTGRDIKYIQGVATRIGNKYSDNNDIHSNSPHALSPLNSDE